MGQKIYSVTSDTVITPSSYDDAVFEWTMPASFADVNALSLYLEIQEAETAEIESFEIESFESESVQISPVYDIVNYAIEEQADGFYATYTVKNVGNADAVGDQVVIAFSDLYHTGEEVEPFLKAPIGMLKVNETKTFTEPLTIDEARFEFGYTNAYMEAQDKNGAALSDYETFMVTVEHPYNISVNGDQELTQIKLKKGETLPLSIDYAPKNFYQGVQSGYDIKDTAVASVKDGVLARASMCRLPSVCGTSARCRTTHCGTTLISARRHPPPPHRPWRGAACSCTSRYRRIPMSLTTIPG